MRRENNKVILKIVPKWLLKYHYSSKNLQQFSFMVEEEDSTLSGNPTKTLQIQTQTTTTNPNHHILA